MEEQLEVVWSGRDTLLPDRESKSDNVWKLIADVLDPSETRKNRGLYKISGEEREWLKEVSEPETSSLVAHNKMDVKNG